MNAIQGGERCYFANSGVTKFRVRQVNYPVDMRNFGMERANPNHYKLRLNEPNSFGQTDYIIYCDYQNPQAFGTEYQIRRNNQIIAQFVAGFDYEIGQSFLESVFIMPGFEVVRMSPYGLGNPSDEPSSGFIRERDDHDVSSGLSATAWPNPFSETLDVVLSGDTQGPLSLQLYNLSGQVVLNQQFEAAQEYYTLSTANLSPGFYMLRVEANGVVQTLKVIKSE
jgi:hypothetical protein